MLENADDNAIVVVRNNWAPAEFLNTSARKMVLVKTNGKLMTPKWAEASGYICEGPLCRQFYSIEVKKIMPDKKVATQASDGPGTRNHHHIQ